MTGRLVPVGRVGRPHGRDGSFYVEGAGHDLPEGLVVSVGGAERAIVRRAGTDERPLVRLTGVDDRTAAEELRRAPLLVPEEESPLADDEWLVEDLVGCSVPGLGPVRAVLAGPSCDVLEVGEEGVLVPLVRDAVVSVDLGERVIEVNRAFLGLEP